VGGDSPTSSHARSQGDADGAGECPANEDADGLTGGESPVKSPWSWPPRWPCCTVTAPAVCSLINWQRAKGGTKPHEHPLDHPDRHPRTRAPRLLLARVLV